jgi:regulator of sirC expression with transglutaminase-like and TPR domain
VATFRNFRLGANLAQDLVAPELLARLERQITRLKRDPNHENALAKLSNSPDLARTLLFREAEKLRAQADDLEAQSRAIHRRAISEKIFETLKGEKEDKLFRAALLIARLDNPEIEVAPYLQEIERMAGEITGALPKDATTAQKVEAVRNYLFKDNGFHGSRSDYYSRSNSYLNEVIDDREGIPITLSLLFIELTRRASAQLHGLGLPGHFVACYQDGKERIIIDPFEGGVAMSHEDANALILAAGFSGTAEEMPIADPTQIISRMLRNLQAIAIEERAFVDAISYVEILVTLNPDNPQERLNRALLHLQSGQPDHAKPDLEWILDHEPEGINLARIRELYQRL